MRKALKGMSWRRCRGRCFMPGGASRVAATPDAPRHRQPEVQSRLSLRASSCFCFHSSGFSISRRRSAAMTE